MKITHISAEFSPIAKAGGLGDVVEGLSHEFQRRKNDVEVILPKYDFLSKVDYKSPYKEKIFSFHFRDRTHKNTLFEATKDQIPLKLLKDHSTHNFLGRKKLYGYKDDLLRFFYFSKAAIEFIKNRNETIDILHIHDWHAAPAALFAKLLPKGLIKKIIFTIHNANYQGICRDFDLLDVGFSKEIISTFKTDHPDYPDTYNLLKAGIVHSDHTTTVSPSYANELLTNTQKEYLDKTLKQNKHKFSGILNGIHTEAFNPQNDPFLKHPFSCSSKIDLAKEKTKEELSTFTKKNLFNRPWIGTISRLVPQKGPSLIEEGIKTSLKHNACFILLGSSPIPEMQKHFNEIKKKYEKNENVFFYFAYDEAFAHKLYAALDFLLVPSLFEPCGLTQLIAMKYGTIPIVRETGGLKDTVFDLYKNPKKGNGFTFLKATKKETRQAVEKAISWFENHPKKIENIRKKIMKLDHSWKVSGEKYQKVYTTQS